MLDPSKQNGGFPRVKFALHFRKGDKNAVCEENKYEVASIEVTRSGSEEMCADRVRLKDRILEGVSKAVKEVQAFSFQQGSEIVAVTNDDRPLQKLVECLDHALLHGLKHITPGYWAVVKKFTHKDIISDIARLDRLATNLGRSRAWLYQSLNDCALESYVRCFIEHKSTTRKYYVEHGLMRDEQRLVILQTLVSGLDFVTFDLQINIAYFDLVSHIPRSASVDAEDTSEGASTPDDQLSLYSCEDSLSIASATSGAVADIDEISLASSSDAFMPGDPSDKLTKQNRSDSPDVFGETWTHQEKRHSSPHIQVDTAADGEMPPGAESNSTTGGGTLTRSNSDIPVGYVQPQDKKTMRPGSLYTTSSMGEGLSSVTSGNDGDGIADQGDELLVIRLKGKKGKKAKKKKKKGASKSQGNTPTCASGMTLGLMPEEDNVSLELEEDGRSKSSSFSSQMSMSDRSSVVDLSGATCKLVGQNGSNPSLVSDAERVASLEQSTDDVADRQSPTVTSPRNVEIGDGSGVPTPLQEQRDDILDGKFPDGELNRQRPDGKVGDIDLNPSTVDKSDTAIVPDTEVESDTVTMQDSSIESQNVQSILPTTPPAETGPDEPGRNVSRLPYSSSLNYDSTIEYQLYSVDSVAELKSTPNHLPQCKVESIAAGVISTPTPLPQSQVQFETSLDDSMLMNLSLDDPGYTNLLLTNAIPTSSTPITEQSQHDLLPPSEHDSSPSGQGSHDSSPSGQGSLTGHGSTASAEELSSNKPETEVSNIDGNESGGSSPLGERVSPDGIESVEVVVGEECQADVKDSSSETAMEASASVDCCEEVHIDTEEPPPIARPTQITSHKSEIIVDNNAKLYLMLEIFKNEHEEFKKLMRLSTGHTEGDLEPLFVLLTDQAIYLLRRGERVHMYSTETRIVYNDLDYISVGINYQTIQIVCTNRRNQYWLNTGDEQLSRYFLQELMAAMEGGSRTRNQPSILTDATTQRISMQKFAAKECHTEMQDTKVHLYSLIHWEDLVDSGTDADMQLYQPMIVKEGKLQYKTAGSFLVGSYWKDGYFMLRNDTFYRFGHRKDKEPDIAVQLRTQHFGGCRRIRSGERPSCFELILQDGTSLEIACKNETDVSNWLQAICSVVAQGVMLQHQGKTHSPCQPCCSVIAGKKLIICHEDSQTNFYRSLASCDIADITTVAVDQNVPEYVILEFQSPDNPWVIHFNCTQEKETFISTINAMWKEQFQVDLPVHDIEDERVQKRCRECLTLIQSSWQRCDSLTRGRIGGNIW